MKAREWAREEIGDLKASSEWLKNREASEKIWNRALSSVGKGRLNPRLEEFFREKGFNLSPTASHEQELFKLKRQLLIGACDYLKIHPIHDNRITPKKIYTILRFSPHFGHLVSYGLIQSWTSGKAVGFTDITRLYKIYTHPLERYRQAVRAWWEAHPEEGPPEPAEIAAILNVTPRAVKYHMTNNPQFAQMMRQKPNGIGG